MARHLKVAHPTEYDVWEAELGVEVDEYQRSNRNEIAERHELVENGQIELTHHNNIHTTLHSLQTRDKHNQQQITTQYRECSTRQHQHSGNFFFKYNFLYFIFIGIEVKYIEEEEVEESGVEIVENCEIEAPPTLQPEPEVEDNENNAYEVVYQDSEWEFFD